MTSPGTCAGTTSGVRTTTSASTEFLRSVISELCLFERRPDVPWGDDRATAKWIRQWADETPREDWTRLPQTTALDLLAVRLEMTDLDAIAEVLRADADAALRSFVGHDHWPTDRSCLSIDRERVAAAFPTCDADELCLLVARALGRRHAIGLLGRDGLARLGLASVDHPCGFDTAFRTPTSSWTSNWAHRPRQPLPHRARVGTAPVVELGRGRGPDVL